MASRKLTTNEIEFARYVFGSTLPYNRITVTNHAGTGKRQFVTPGIVRDGFVIHWGKESFDDLTNYAPAFGHYDYQHNFILEGRICDIFIHELTHVWQGHNNAHAWGFVKASLKAQIKQGQAAYNVEAMTQNFKEFNPEQQATIVEQWHFDGAYESHEFYPYIRDNIRAGAPNARTNFAGMGE